MSLRSTLAAVLASTSLLACTSATPAPRKPAPIATAPRDAESVNLPDMTPKPVDPSNAATELATMDFFALGGVGFAGVTSRGQELTEAIAGAPDAVAQLKQLATTAGPVAQLYAVWALRTLDPKAAEAPLARLRADKTVVRSMHGCIMMEESVADIAGQIDKDERPLTRPS